jgi:cytochrome c peroxidase
MPRPRTRGCNVHPRGGCLAGSVVLRSASPEHRAHSCAGSPPPWARLRKVALFALVAATVAAVVPAAAQGPGLSNRAWETTNLFSPVGFVRSAGGGHGNVTLVQGYLMVIVSQDGGGTPADGALEFWDLHDPTAPTLAVRYEDESTHRLREAHGFSLAWQGDRLVLSAQTEEGLALWDVTDPRAAIELSSLDLPDITVGDYSGNWWSFAVGPWIYVAGADSGLFVVDAHDPGAPRLVRRVTTGELAGVVPAQVFVVGTLAVVMEAQNRGFATLDVSRPDAPRLLRTRNGAAGYSHLFAGDGKILTSGNIPPRVAIAQVGHDGAIDDVASFALFFNSGGYGSYQDGAFLSGFSDRIIKADVAAREIVGSGASGLDGRDEDFATVLGNLVFAGDDHGKGSALYPHTLAPDLSPPIVAWMHPADGSTGLALTSAVGLSFSDHIDVASLNNETVSLHNEATGERVALTPSGQLSLVNLVPEQPLQAQTTYRLVAQGVRDVVGNESPRFEATFVTGDGVASARPQDVLASLQTSSLFGEYALTTFGPGVLSYLDRDFVWSAAPPARLVGMPAIQTRNNDKRSFSDDFLRFSLQSPAEVVVLYDQRGDVPPEWLASFVETGEVVHNDDTSYRLFSKAMPAGEVVLGGNAARGASGPESMYVVVVVPRELSCSLSLTPAPPGVVTLHVQEPASARYDWNVGDLSQPNAGPTTSLPLPVGRHSVVVTMTSGAQSTTCSAVQIVTPTPSPLSRSSSGSVLSLADGRTVGVVTTEGVVVFVDGAHANAETQPEASAPVRIALPAARDGITPTPVALALTSRGEVAALDAAGAAIHLIDPTTTTVVQTWLLPRASRPGGLVADDDGGVFVTLSATGEVVHVDGAGHVLERAFVAPTVRGLARHGARLLVSRFLSPDTQGEVFVLDTAPLSVAGVIALPFDPGPDTEASGRGVPSLLSSVLVAPDGVHAYVSGTKANIARGLFSDGQPLTFESRVRAFVATLNLSTLTEDVARRIDVNDREGPVGLWISPAGDLLFVAARGNNVVDVFDVVSSSPASAARRVAQFATRSGPVSFAQGRDGRLVVDAMLDGALDFFEVSSLLAGRSNHVNRSTFVTTSMSDPTAMLEVGRRLFFAAGDRRMSKDGYISCASCHPDGGHDGRTWDFTQAGEGLRNTISLRGPGGMGHGRVHWTANFDEIQDFENDIRNAFGGTGLLSDEDFAATSDPLGATKAGHSAELDALALYVSSLGHFPDSPWRTAEGTLSAAARRGRAVFGRAACSTCHAGPTFTDNQRHDVGTLQEGSGQGSHQALHGVGFDTPTLLGVWDTAPYLHNGAAPTLHDALALHQNIPALSQNDQSDLVAYLLSLDDRSLPPEADCSLADECLDDEDDGRENVDVAVDVGDDDGEDGAGEEGTPTVAGCNCDGGASGDFFSLFLALGAAGRLRNRRGRTTQPTKPSAGARL